MRTDKAKPIRTQSDTLMLVCVCLIALACIHCGGGKDRAYSRGSTVIVLHPGEERVFAGLRWPAQFLLFLPLVTYDENEELEGRLAKSWEHSPDYREWTYHLRTDVRWHDGVPVTAHDVRFTLELFDAIWNRPSTATITVVDDSTLKMRYAEPTDALDWWAVYYPKHLLEDLDPNEFWDWEFWKHPVGNGPYRYVRHVPKTMVELEANPDYYRGKPKIERVVLKFGGSAPLPELLSGNVDALTWVNRVGIPKLRADPRFRVYYHIFPGVDWLDALIWNHRDSLFSDPSIRRALTLAINRRELHSVLNLPPDLAVFDVVFTGGQYWRGELPEPVPYDPERAKTLLKRAGWRDEDGDGVRERAGKELSFIVLAPPVGMEDAFSMGHAAVYIQAELGQVGGHMRIQSLEGSVVRQRVESGNFQAAFFRIHNQPGGLRGHLTWFGDGSWIGYENPKVAALLEAAKIAIDPEKKDRIYHELMPILRADLPITFLYPEVGTTVAHRRIQGLSSPFRAGPLMNMEYLWLEERQ